MSINDKLTELAIAKAALAKCEGDERPFEAIANEEFFKLKKELLPEWMLWASIAFAVLGGLAIGYIITP